MAVISVQGRDDPLRIAHPGSNAVSQVVATIPWGALYTPGSSPLSEFHINVDLRQPFSCVPINHLAMFQFRGREGMFLTVIGGMLGNPCWAHSCHGPWIILYVAFHKQVMTSVTIGGTIRS